MNNFSKVFQLKSFFRRSLRNPAPDNIPLSNMLNSRCPVHKVMNLAFQDRFEIHFHFPPCHLNNHTHIHRGAVFQIVKCGTDHFYFSVRDVFHIRHEEVLKGSGVFTSKFNPHICPANNLSFKGRSIWHGNRNIRDLDFHTSDLDAFLNQFSGPIQIIFSFNFIERHTNNMFVCCDTRG